jgi:choline dehydrogenase-like flavoprotein
MARGYDAIVIGTGFGGSVADCRLAQAGFKVKVLSVAGAMTSIPFPETGRTRLTAGSGKSGKASST